MSLGYLIAEHYHNFFCLLFAVTSLSAEEEEAKENALLENKINKGMQQKKIAQWYSGKAKEKKRCGGGSISKQANYCTVVHKHTISRTVVANKSPSPSPPPKRLIIINGQGDVGMLTRKQRKEKQTTKLAAPKGERRREEEGKRGQAADKLGRNCEQKTEQTEKRASNQLVCSVVTKKNPIQTKVIIPFHYANRLVK